MGLLGTAHKEATRIFHTHEALPVIYVLCPKTSFVIFMRCEPVSVTFPAMQTAVLTATGSKQFWSMSMKHEIVA